PHGPPQRLSPSDGRARRRRGLARRRVRRPLPPAHGRLQGDGHLARHLAGGTGHEPGAGGAADNPHPAAYARGSRPVPTLLVIAKEPRPGQVKTRLTPPFTPREAASLAEASLADTLETVARTPARRRVLVLQGEPGPWLPPGFDVVRQCPGGLDERLAAAF